MLRVACVALIAACALGWSSARSEPTQGAAASIEQPLDPKLNEQIVKVPIALRLRNGTMYRGEFVLSTFRPNGPGPFPTVISNHGRNSRKRPEFGRSRMQASFWVRRGFAVLAPTRIGYGVSGTAVDPEAVYGQCDRWDHEPPAAAIRAHIRATVEYAATQSWIAKDNLLLSGGSAGGFGAIVAAGDRPRGLKGIVNFAGGTGGRLEEEVVPACNPRSVEQMMAAAGRRNPVPSIWFYSQNDRRWGPTLPRTWHTAYVKAGGKAEFHMLPPFGDDGHDLTGLPAAFEHWSLLLDRFLVSIGYAPRKPPPDAPPATNFAPIDDIAKVPLITKKGREIYADFLKKDVPRAFAIGRKGASVYFAGQLDAVAKTLARCEELAKEACRLYAVNDNVVWEPYGPAP